MSDLLPVLRSRYFDDNGDPLAGGKLYSYIAGTSAPTSTFTDQSGNTPNANPVILDANGEASVWIADGLYKFILKDANDVVQFTTDFVSGPSSGSGSSPSGWTLYTVTNGQTASDLAGQTTDGLAFTSAIYEYEIIRSTTVFSNGRFSLQYLNGVWRLSTGFDEGDLSGVTFSISQVSTTAQLKAALDSGAGNGTIKISRRLIPA